MTKLALLAGVLLATGCSRKPDYEGACTHMIELANVALEKEIASIEKQDKDGSMKTAAKQLREHAASSPRSDLATCKVMMAENQIDPECIRGANTVEDASQCLNK